MALPDHGPDDHEWFAFFRQQEPPCTVADCACGARAKIYPSVFGMPEIRIEAPSSAGPENAIIKDGANALGDPQAARLAMLMRG